MLNKKLHLGTTIHIPQPLLSDTKKNVVYSQSPGYILGTTHKDKHTGNLIDEFGPVYTSIKAALGAWGFFVLNGSAFKYLVSNTIYLQPKTAIAYLICSVDKENVEPGLESIMREQRVEKGDLLTILQIENAINFMNAETAHEILYCDNEDQALKIFHNVEALTR